MVKRLAVHIGEFKKDTLMAPASVILEVILEVLLPVLMASVIDRGVEAGDMNYVVKMGGLMLIVAMLSLLAGTMSGIFAARASMGFGRNLRKAMYDNIQDFAFRNIDRFSTAGLVTRMTTDVTNVQNAFQPDVCTGADHDDFRAVHVYNHQSPAFADLSGGAGVPGMHDGIYHHPCVSHF